MRCKLCDCRTEDTQLCNLCKQHSEEFYEDMCIEEAEADFKFFDAPEDFEEQDNVFTFSDDPVVEDIPF